MTQPDFKEYAGFFRRLAAGLIDSLFFLFITVIVQAISTGGPGVQLSVDQGNLGFHTNGSFVEQLIAAIITIIMWKKLLGTPGKLLMECHVVDARTGKPITYTQGAIRYLGYFVSLIPFGLGFLWILWDKRKQGFHDKIAKTVVLRESTHLRDDESTKSLDQLLREVR